MLSMQPADGLGFVGKEAVGERQLLRLGANRVYGQAREHVVSLHDGPVAVLPVDNGARQLLLHQVDLLVRHVRRHLALVNEQLA